MVGGDRKAPGWSTLAGIGGLIGLPALALVPSADAAEKPLTRYSIVHGCYSLATTSGDTVAKQSGGYVIGSGNAEAFRMQATDLGRYLFYGRDADFLALDGEAVAPAAQPSDDSDWTVNESGAGFTIVNEYAGKALATDGANLVAVAAGAAERFEFVEASGCLSYPEVDVGASGGPAIGSPAYGEVVGTVDGHMHGMAYEFLGGKAHCGRPFHRFGAPYALVDCPDHEAGGGCAAVLENVLYGNPARCHDPVGWPTFKDWPDYKSLTHEQSYWRWLERANAGGLKIFVNLFVENRVLCDLYPLKQNSCNEMDSVLLQAKRIREMQDYIDGNGLAALLPGGTLPVYPDGPVCNTRGLSPLGEHAIREIVDRGMIFDPDHMSVFGRQQAISLVESLDYSGIVSSHSWSTDDALPRIYALGGVITPYAGGSTGFVEQWRHLRDFYRRAGTQYFGVGYGADMNGFGAQGPPRGADVPNPVTYPFRSMDGSTTLVRQRSGERVFDINTDGVAHYGLYPDWIEDLRMQAGDRIVRDLSRGAEAYLQMWERAGGIEGVRCDRWRQRFLTSRGIPRRLQLGDRPKRVLKRAGQPVSRTRTWRFCANGRKRAKALEMKAGKKQVAAVFNKRGRVALIASTLRRQRAEGLRVGMAASDLRKRAERFGGLWVRDAGNGRKFSYGVRKGRISYVAVASSGAATSPATLKRYLRRARVR